MEIIDGSRRFLAGRRIFRVDGTQFLVLFGMSPFAGQNYEILESLLIKSGIHLGDFLTANLTARNSLKDFKKLHHPIDVKVENNFAIMKFAPAELTRDSGVLVFKTRDFGSVRSENQKLPLGSYEIVIKARGSTVLYDITLYAKTIKAIGSSAKKQPSSTGYEMPLSKLKRQKEIIEESAYSGYEYIESIPSASNYYLQLLSNNSKVPSTRELIARFEALVGELNLAYSKQKSAKVPTKSEKFMPVMKVKPNKVETSKPKTTCV